MTVLLALGMVLWRLDARFTDLEIRMEARLSAVEAKLDLLIEGFDIIVTPKEGENQ